MSQVGGRAVVDLCDLEGMVPLEAEVLQFQPWLPPAKAKRSSPTAHGVFYSAALLPLDELAFNSRSNLRFEFYL